LGVLDGTRAFDSYSYVEYEAAVGRASDGVEVGFGYLGDFLE
jgi:hypothetical protein